MPCASWPGEQVRVRCPSLTTRHKNRAKHDAWAKLGATSKAKAIEQYLKLIDEVAPRWRAWKKAKL